MDELFLLRAVQLGTVADSWTNKTNYPGNFDSLFLANRHHVLTISY